MTAKTFTSGYEVQLLGGFALRHSGRLHWVRPSCQRLIALLALESGMDRTDAGVRLFDYGSAAQASGNLRSVLRRTRIDAEGLVEGHGRALWINAECVDADQVHRWAETLLHGSPEVPARPPHTGHELLPGWSEGWLVAPREHLHMRQIYALEEHAARSLVIGRYGDAATSAMLAAGLDPLRETSQRLLIEIALREGNVVDAVRRYRRYERDLADEIATRPGITLQTLVEPYLHRPLTEVVPRPRLNH